MNASVEDRSISVSPERVSVTLKDGALHGWRWRNREAPQMIFVHATGFCASTYKSVLQLVARDFEVIAIDLRGHGRTTLPADPDSLQSWETYADDLRGFLNAEPVASRVLAGHSLGGVVACLAAKGRDDISAIRIVEPAIVPVYLQPINRTALWTRMMRRLPIARGAEKRRDGWRDRKEVSAQYANRATFRDWAPGVLDDYLADGLVSDPAGVRLSCAPLWEAATFRAQRHDFWGSVRQASAPMCVLASIQRSSTVTPSSRFALRLFGAKVHATSQVGHLAPMQAPELVAAFLAGESRDE
ncbi:MAG: alpha/beta hydrolase [Pseudomonadota bacterium]